MNDPVRHRRLSVRGITIAAAAAAVLVGGAVVAAADEGGGATPSGSTPVPSGSAAPADPSGSAATADPSAADPSGGPATPPAPRPHLDGTVTSVQSGTILITDPEGFTRTIHTSGDTTYGDGIAQPIEVGERIHAEGAVDSDSTSLAATLIAAAPEPPTPGTAGPGGGPAGPPAPPTDGSAPTPPAPPADGSMPTPPSGGAPAPAGSGAPASGPSSAAPTS